MARPDYANLLKAKIHQISNGNPKMLMTALSFMLVIIATGGFLALSTAEADRNPAQDIIDQALSVDVTDAKVQTNYTIDEKYTGRVVAKRDSDHGFERAGLLVDMLVDDGDRVSKGDVLAILDMRKLDSQQNELSAQLAEAEAQKAQILATTEQAKRQYERYKTLSKQGHVSQQRFDDAKFSYESLKAQAVSADAAIVRVKAMLESLAVDRELSQLTARFDGSVTRRYVDEGTALFPGTAVVRIVEDTALEIQVGLSEKTLSELVIDQPYDFVINNQVHQAHLKAVVDQIDPQTRTFMAVFNRINTGDNKITIKPGTLAKLVLETTVPSEGFWIPHEALSESIRGLWSIYALKQYQTTEEQDTAALAGIYQLSRREVQVLYHNADQAFVRGTLQDGDKVVVGGQHRLTPGMLVRVHNLSTAKAGE